MQEMFTQGWNELLGRETGPLHLRFVLQPLVATFFAMRAGLKDAREGSPLFFWLFVLDAQKRRALLGQLWKDVGKLFLVACLLDVVYQLLVLRWIHVMQAVLVATGLAILPYLVIRGLANRWGRCIGSRESEKEGGAST